MTAHYRPGEGAVGVYDSHEAGRGGSAHCQRYSADQDNRDRHPGSKTREVGRWSAWPVHFLRRIALQAFVEVLVHAQQLDCFSTCTPTR